MDDYEKALIAMLACAALFVVVSIPLIARKIPRNTLYGVRTERTLHDDLGWYEANKRLGRRLLVAGLFSAVAVLVLYYTAISLELFVYSALIAVITPALAAGLDALLFVRSGRKRDVRDAP